MTAPAPERPPEVQVFKACPKSRWLPDNAAPKCLKCGSQFTLTNRRHHCRCCGKIYCDVCCHNTTAMVDGETGALIEGGPQRVCDVCFVQGHFPHRKESSLTTTVAFPSPTR